MCSYLCSYFVFLLMFLFIFLFMFILAFLFALLFVLLFVCVGLNRSPPFVFDLAYSGNNEIVGNIHNAYHRRGDQLGETGNTLDHKLNIYLRNFHGLQKSSWKYTWSTKSETLVKSPVNLEFSILHFHSRHLKYAHPGILALLWRDRNANLCKWHFPDPELIADALKCKKMLKSEIFTFCATWLHQNIIAGSRCSGCTIKSQDDHISYDIVSYTK